MIYIVYNQPVMFLTQESVDIGPFKKGAQRNQFDMWFDLADIDLSNWIIRILEV